MAVSNLFLEQEPVQSGKDQAGTASCWDGLGEVYLFLHGMIEANCQIGKARLHRREKNVLTEPVSCRAHRRHGALSVFHPTNLISLGGRLCGWWEMQRRALGVTEAGSVANEVLGTQPES